MNDREHYRRTQRTLRDRVKRERNREAERQIKRAHQLALAEAKKLEFELVDSYEGEAPWFHWFWRNPDGTRSDGLSDRDKRPRPPADQDDDLPF